MLKACPLNFATMFETDNSYTVSKTQETVTFSNNSNKSGLNQ